MTRIGFEIDNVLTVDNGASPEDREIAIKMVQAIFDAAPDDLPAARLALCATRAVASICVAAAKEGRAAELLAVAAAFLRQKAESIKPPVAN